MTVACVADFSDDAHHHRALDLVAAGKRIQDSACVHHRHDAADAQARGLRLPRDFRKVAPEGVHGDFRVGDKSRLFTPAR